MHTWFKASTEYQARNSKILMSSWNLRALPSVTPNPSSANTGVVSYVQSLHSQQRSAFSSYIKDRSTSNVKVQSFLQEMKAYQCTQDCARVHQWRVSGETRSSLATYLQSSPLLIMFTYTLSPPSLLFNTFPLVSNSFRV